MSYRVEFAKQAIKQLNALPMREKQQLESKIDALAAEPRPAGVKKLQGQENLYRIRAGNYRVVYSIQDQKLLVVVVKVGHRREIYR